MSQKSDRGATPWIWNMLVLQITMFLGSAVAPATAQTWPPSPPPELAMTVHETEGVPRAGEVVWSGVPLPRSLNVVDATGLAVIDELGAAVSAQFEVLARWQAALADTTAPVQWLLVAFPATVTANGSAVYRLVTDGSVTNPTPSVALQLSQSGDQVTVDTGVATFVFGGVASNLFDEIRLGDGTVVVNGGAMSAVVDGANLTHPTTRAVRIERYGPLAAAVVVEGAYDMALVGGGGLGSLRRYEFRAASATAVVRHVVNWEGDRCGMDVLECGGSPNALRFTRARDKLNLALAQPRTVSAVGGFVDPALSGTASAGSSAEVRQRLRANRLASLFFEVTVPGTASATGIKSDGGMLAVGDGAASVGIAIDHMHRYEPQALRLLASDSMAVDLVDDAAWLGNRQGLFARIGVAAFSGNPDRAQLDAALWAPLNHPLRAWPSPRWWAASEAVDEMPVGTTLPPDLAEYDTLVSGVLADTMAKIDERGLPGLMTFGLYPRIWGHPWYTDELDCIDPTPGEDWDVAYWCGTWTDYHNTVATVPTWAMRSGEVRWLGELAFPGALRSLHTQVIQCAPGNAFFYCGQAPAGYGGYRADNNASHAYFDNLFLYYWLSGDETVVRILRKGAETMRRFMCSNRGPWPAGDPTGPDGPACAPDDPLTDPWAGVTGRVASQWLAAFRFVGLSSVDPTFLEDYESGLARALTQYYVEAAQNGTDYGFFFGSGDGSIDPITGPGTRLTNQLWMVSLYDVNNLYRLEVDTADTAIGAPALAPSSVQATWARTLVDFGATLAGDGTAAGIWPNSVEATWSGSRIGGTLVQVTADVDPDGNDIPCDADLDECLYDTGKATLSAALVRAGQGAGEARLTAMGRDHAVLGIANAMTPVSPLGKFQGEFLARLHAAVARLAWAEGDAALFSDGFESGNTSAWSPFGRCAMSQSTPASVKSRKSQLRTTSRVPRDEHW